MYGWKMCPILLIIFQLMCPPKIEDIILWFYCEYIVYSCLIVVKLEKAFQMHTFYHVCTMVHIPTTTAWPYNSDGTFVKNKRMLQQQSLWIRIHKYRWWDLRLGLNLLNGSSQPCGIYYVQNTYYMLLNTILPTYQALCSRRTHVRLLYLIIYVSVYSILWSSICLWFVNVRRASLEMSGRCGACGTQYPSIRDTGR